MKNQNAYYLAAKIWVRTAIVFVVSVLVYVALFEKAGGFIFMAAILGTVASLLGSLPVLISMFIVLPILQKINIKIEHKFFLFLLFVLFVTACYGFIAALINVDITIMKGVIENEFLSDFVWCTLILFFAAAAAILTCMQAILFYFNSNNNIQKSLFSFFSFLYKTKIKTTIMDNQTTIQNTQEEPYSNEFRTNFPEKENKTSTAILIKGVITGFLILLLLIPTFFIQSLIQERKGLQEEVVKEVSSKWANAQTVSAPFITVPYTEQFTNAEGKVETAKRNLIIIADKLETKGDIVPEVRKRSIYKVLLYRSDLKFAGNFKPTFPQDINAATIDFTNAKICFALSDFKGIEEEMNITFNNQKISLTPGLPFDDFGNVGVSAPIVLSAATLAAGINFDMNVKIKGSQQLHLLPLGSNTKFTISSEWNSPSFDGSTLPQEHETNDSGFVAKWNYSSVNLPFAAVTRSKFMKVQETAFGVTLVQPADQYSKTTRSVKYAILLIGLSFALFFIIELMQKKPLHPVQYVLVGLALVIFYTLLLSIGEYVVFDLAYLIAAIATISLITLYAKSHFDSWKSASIFAALLSCLYAFVFILIKLEDAALLVGSIGLFIILALLMYGSRKINWYGK